MGANPAYLASVAGQEANAGAVNQFLGSHSAQFLYTGGAVQSQGGTGTGLYQTTATQWYSQLINTTSTQTGIGSVNLQISAVGGSPTSQLIAPLVVTLYADSGGLPTGPALATATLTSTFVYTAPFWLTVPLVATGLTPSTFYHIVVQEVGSGSHYYAWQQSNTGFGALTAPDGVTWTTQAYGLMYQVFDLSGTGQLVSIIEDGGTRWSQLSYNGQGLLSQIVEYTVGQTATGYLQGTRTLTYTNGFLTGVS